MKQQAVYKGVISGTRISLSNPWDSPRDPVKQSQSKVRSEVWLTVHADIELVKKVLNR